jgi:preprotein translocase subunit YajC
MFVNFLYAADETVKASSPANSTYAMAMQIVPFALIFVLFYLFLVRPQKKKQKLHSDMLSSLKIGDKVLTNSGMVCKIVKIKDENSLLVEIADKVEVEILRSYVVSKMEK